MALRRLVGALRFAMIPLAFGVVALGCASTTFSPSQTKKNTNEDGTGTDAGEDTDANSGSTSSHRAEGNAIDAESDHVENGDGSVTDRFSLTTSSKQIDMVWILDNSGSMGNKIAQVRSNVGNFLASLKGRADIHMLLITQAGTTPLSYTLPPEAAAAGHLQLDLTVQSYNDLAIAAAAICPEDTTTIDVGGGLLPTPDTVTICGKVIANHGAPGEPFTLPPKTLEDPANVIKARGILRSHLRKDARLMFVMVSDEDSSVVDDSNFLDLIKPYATDAKPRVFSFTGLASSTTCTLIDKGAAYEALAAATGAAAFDICAPDWSPNFSKLTERAIAAAATEFSLRTKGAKKIVSVALDGKTLSASAYKLEDGVVVLGNGVSTINAKTLTIRYEL